MTGLAYLLLYAQIQSKKNVYIKCKNEFIIKIKQIKNFEAIFSASVWK